MNKIKISCFIIISIFILTDWQVIPTQVIDTTILGPLQIAFDSVEDDEGYVDTFLLLRGSGE
jgi:hypothetical protein